MSTFRQVLVGTILIALAVTVGIWFLFTHVITPAQDTDLIGKVINYCFLTIFILVGSVFWIGPLLLLISIYAREKTRDVSDVLSPEKIRKIKLSVVDDGYNDITGAIGYQVQAQLNNSEEWVRIDYIEDGGVIINFLKNCAHGINETFLLDEELIKRLIRKGFIFIEEKKERKLPCLLAEFIHDIQIRKK
jgi:CRISPR/Cas system-associated protein Csx1